MSYTGVFVANVRPELIAAIYESKEVGLSLFRKMCLTDAYEEGRFPQNAFIVLKGYEDGVHNGSVIVRVKGDNLVLVIDYMKKVAPFITARNKEQAMLLNLLYDQTVPCVAVEGRAGSGKTYCALAYALDTCLEAKGKNRLYDSVIITRPMTTVGSSIGHLPGTAEEKFEPYIGNYLTNFASLLSEKFEIKYETWLKNGDLELMPMALIGGSSFEKALIIADEIQSLDYEEMYALGSRVAQGSKLILMGDSRQRYGQRVSVERTGLHRMVNSDHSLASPLFGSIKLIKQERSPVVDLFYQVFSGEDNAS